MKEFIPFLVVGAIVLIGLAAVDSQIWQECTQKGMSGFYCFMQLK